MRGNLETFEAQEEEMMVKKVLIATDGSSHANKAIQFGSDIAAKYGAEVVLVHVLLRDHLSENLRHMAEVEYQVAEGGKPLYESIAAIPNARFPAANLVPKDAQTPERALQAVAEQILAAAERTAREHGVSKVSKQIEDGNPASRILEVANDVNADMIVTGARGLSDLKTLLLGSVSHKLSNMALVTCVTVR
jgi:nucleotide-binding universal stress UspA family protein